LAQVSAPNAKALLGLFFVANNGEIFACIDFADWHSCDGTYICKLGRRNSRENGFDQIPGTLVRSLQEDEARLGQADEELEQG